jgi:hypothetical protein
MDVREVVYLRTNVSTGCCHCDRRVGGEDEFADSVNHYIQQHRYILLHVGQQTTRDGDGMPWQTTVAVLGLPGDTPANEFR